MNPKQIDGRTLRFQHRRPELLAAATEYVLDHGLTGLSLRPVAQALGITHATLLRHFSSKEELIMHVVEKIRTDVAAQLAADAKLSGARSTAELMKIAWRRLCEPEEQRQFRLLFEVVAGRIRDPGRDADLSRSVVYDWLDLLTGRLTQDGWPPEEASALATLVLAQVRGLQLDLLITKDQARADRAIDHITRLLEPPLST